MIMILGTTGYVLLGVGAVVLAILFWIVTMRRTVVRLDRLSAEAEAVVDLALSRRFDILSNMMAIVHGVGIPTEPLNAFVAWPDGIPSGAMIADKALFAVGMDRLKETLVALSETDALSKAPRFHELAAGLSNSEQRLRAAVRMYNAAVHHRNVFLFTFPQKLITDALGLDRKAAFDIVRDAKSTEQRN
jgi:LemA protein